MWVTLTKSIKFGVKLFIYSPCNVCREEVGDNVGVCVECQVGFIRNVEAFQQGSNWEKRGAGMEIITIAVPASGRRGMAYHFIPSHF